MLYVFLFSSMHITYPAHHPLGFIILIIFSTEYNFPSMQFPLASWFIVLPKYKYLPQHPVLIHPLHSYPNMIVKIPDQKNL